MLSPEHYMTIEEAAEALGVKERALRQRVQRKSVDSIELFGRRLIHRDTVALEKKKNVRRGRPKS